MVAFLVERHHSLEREALERRHITAVPRRRDLPVGGVLARYLLLLFDLVGIGSPAIDPSCLVPDPVGAKLWTLAHQVPGPACRALLDLLDDRVLLDSWLLVVLARNECLLRRPLLP